MEKKILLLADDDIDDKELFCEALELIDRNIVCHIAGDGREVLNMLNSLPELPQLIFLDINMPGMNGWQCLEKLKANDRYRVIPVIVISTSSHQREMDIARTLGALSYFTKPHHFSELIEILRVIVANISTELKPALQDMKDNGSKYIHVL